MKCLGKKVSCLGALVASLAITSPGLAEEKKVDCDEYVDALMAYVEIDQKAPGSIKFYFKENPEITDDLFERISDTLLEKTNGQYSFTRHKKEDGTKGYKLEKNEITKVKF